MPTAQNKFITTDKQRTWLARIEKVVLQHAEETRIADETNSFNYNLASALQRIGYTSLAVPQPFGGEGISLTDLILYQERIAQTDASIALAIGWHMNTALQLASAQQWQEEQLAALYGDLLKCGALINRADSEAATGSPSRGGRPQTTAARIEGGYRLQGTKTFTSLAPVLDYFIVSAFDLETNLIADFLIPRNTAGVTIKETWNMLGMRGTGSHDLVLQDVVVPATAKVYERQKPAQASRLSPYQLFIPAVYLGIALAARDEAIRFAKQYQPNSLPRPIAELPNIQQSIGQIELELTAARHFLYGVAERFDRQQEGGLDAGQLVSDEDIAAVKVLAVQQAMSVVDRAMRIVGSHSLKMSHPLQRMYRDVRFGLHNPPMEDLALQQLAMQAIREVAP